MPPVLRDRVVVSVWDHAKTNLETSAPRHASETTPAKTPPEPWMMGAATAVSIRALIMQGILDLILVGGLILVLTTRVRLAIRRVLGIQFALAIREKSGTVRALSVPHSVARAVSITKESSTVIRVEEQIRVRGIPELLGRTAAMGLERATETKQTLKIILATEIRHAW